jgi:hypothetical protein
MIAKLLTLAFSPPPFQKLHKAELLAKGKESRSAENEIEVCWV